MTLWTKYSVDVAFGSKYTLVAVWLDVHNITAPLDYVYKFAERTAKQKVQLIQGLENMKETLLRAYVSTQVVRGELPSWP